MRLLFFYLTFFIVTYTSAQTFPVSVNNDMRALVRGQFPNFITPPIYYKITETYAKTFVVQGNGGDGMLDSLAKPIIDPNLGYFVNSIEDSLSKEFYFFFSNTTEQIMVNAKGKVLCRLPFADVKQKWGDLLWINVSTYDTINNKYFKEGENTDKVGIMDLNGKWLIEPRVVNFEFTSRNCFIMYDNTPNAKRKISVLDHKAQLIVEDEITLVRNRELGDSIFRLRQTAVFNNEMAWLIDSTGHVVEKKKRTLRPKEFYDNSSGKYGIKHNMGIVVEPQYDKIESFDNYFIAYNRDSNLCDIYDKKGALLTTKNHYNIISLHHESGQAHFTECLVGKNAKNGYYFLNDEFDAASPVFDFLDKRALHVVNDTAVFIVGLKKKYGVVNSSGKIIVPCTYTNTAHPEEDMIKIETKFNVFDYYTMKGDVISKGVYKVHHCTINPNLYIISSTKGIFVCSIKPYTQLLSSKDYGSFWENARSKFIYALNNGPAYVFDKNTLKLVGSRPLRWIEDDLGDSNTVVALYRDNYKRQFVDNQMNKVSEEYDHIRKLDPKQQLYLVCNEDKKNDRKRSYGVINIKGKVFLQPEWDTVILENKYAVLVKNNTFFVTDSSFVVNKNMIIDSIDHTWRYHGTAYRSNSKWGMLGHYDPKIAFDKIVKIHQSGKMNVKINDKHGIYDLYNNKWTIPPQFDSVVNIIANYSPNRFFYTTKIGKSYYFVDSITGIIRGDGYASIDHLQYYYDQPYRIVPDLLAHKGETKTSEHTEHLIGAKFSMVNTKGKRLNTIDADHVELLMYDDISGYEFVFALLWNVGGISKEYITSGPDSVETVFVDGDREYIGKKVIGPRYRRKIIGGKFGILSINGKEILPPIYDDIKFDISYGYKEMSATYSFSDSLKHLEDLKIRAFPIFIQKEKLWGMADLTGKILIPTQYDSIKVSGLYTTAIKAWSKGAFGYFDLLGKPILPVEFNAYQDYFVNFSEEFIWIFQKGGTASTYVLTGDSTMEQTFDNDGMEYFKNVALTIDQKHFTGGTYGMYNLQRQSWICEPVYEEIIFTQEFKVPGSDHPKYIRMPVTGKYSMQRTYAMDHSQPMLVKKGGKWGACERYGKLFVPCLYDSITIYWLESEKVQAWSNGAYGIYDTTGKQLVPIEFSGDAYYGISGVDENYGVIFQRGGTTTTYTLSADSVNVSTYDESGYEILVKELRIAEQKQFTGGKYGFYDLKKSVWVLDPIYDDIIFSQGFSIRDSGDVYLRRSVTGKYSNELKYLIEENSAFQIKKDGKWGIYMYGKGIILKPEFDEIKIEKEEIIAKQADVEKHFTLDGKQK